MNAQAAADGWCTEGEGAADKKQERCRATRGCSLDFLCSTNYQLKE